MTLPPGVDEVAEASPDTEQVNDNLELRAFIIMRALVDEEVLSSPRGSAERPEVDFRVNDRVQIVGLRNQSHLNGSYGRLISKGTQTPNRWIVNLEDSTSTATVSVRNIYLVAAQENPSRTSCVLLHSLQERKDLNGQSAHVIDTDPQCSSRIIVSTGTNAHLSVPVACTLVLPNVSSTSVLSRVQLTYQCCICMQVGDTTTVADPCGHTKVCDECSRQFRVNAPCPICRKPVLML